MSYPSAQYAEPRMIERSMWLLAAAASVLMLGFAALVLLSGGGLTHALTYVGLGIIEAFPFFVAAVVLRTFRMKRVAERAAFLANMEMAAHG